MPEELAIETKDLIKRYGDSRAVNGLTMAVPRGSICALLGSNGAGKSTTLRMLIGITRPTAGSGFVFGLRIDNPSDSLGIRRRTALISEDKTFPPSLTVGELIDFTRAFYPEWDRELELRYLQRFELSRKAIPASLSKGMRCRLALLLALARGADLLLLDEPTDGLDPAMIEEGLQALVACTADRGTTILFSTHQLADVEQIADRVCIIAAGRVLVEGSLDEIKTSYCRVDLVFEDDAPEGRFEGARRDGRTLSLIAARNVDDVVARAKALNARSVEVAPVTLREIFLESTKGVKE